MSSTAHPGLAATEPLLLPPPPPLSSTSTDITPAASASSLLFAKVKRSDSLRSETSDQSSENRRVSFNNDVRVKRIPKSRLAEGINSGDSTVRSAFSTFKPIEAADDLETGPFAEVTKERPPATARAIADEAALILRQLDGVECSASTKPEAAAVAPTTSLTRPRNSSSHRPPPPPIQPKPKFVLSSGQTPTHQNGHKLFSSPSPHPTTTSTGPEYNSHGSISSSGVSSGSSPTAAGAATTTAASSSAEDSSGINNKTATANELYGLHALNNLDIAVNGKNVNTMPSYQEIRRAAAAAAERHQQLDSSGGSAVEYSPPSPARFANNGGSNSNNVRSTFSPPHKPPRKTPSRSPPPPHHGRMMSSADRPASQMVSSMMEQLSQDSRFRSRKMMMSTTTDHSDDESNIASSTYSSVMMANNRSGNNNPVPPPRRTSVSPSRTCMTDSEILRSPAEVLYAVSDKSRASQTVNEGYHHHHHHQNVPRFRSSSRDDLLGGTTGVMEHVSRYSNVGMGNSRNNANRRMHQVRDKRIVTFQFANFQMLPQAQHN